MTNQINRKRHKKTDAQARRKKEPKCWIMPGAQLPDDAMPEMRGRVSMHPDGVWRPVEPIGRILADQGDPIAIGQLCPIPTCVR